MRYLLIVMVLLSTGCTGFRAQLDEYTEDGAEAAADTADTAFEAGVWGACNAPTFGAVTRACNNDPECVKKHAEDCKEMRNLVGDE